MSALRNRTPRPVQHVGTVTGGAFHPAPAPAPTVETFATAPTFGIDFTGASAELRADSHRATMTPGPTA
jgi:hypothetical protein